MKRVIGSMTGGRHIRRREFLLSGAALGALASLGISVPAKTVRRLSKMPGEERVVEGASGVHEALMIAAAILPSYEPPAAAVTDYPRWIARYETFLWFPVNQPNTPPVRAVNMTTGSLVVAGDPAAGVYQVAGRRVMKGLANIFRTRLRCDAGAVPRVREWTTEFMVESPLTDYDGSRLTESAVADAGRARWMNPASRAPVDLPDGGLMADGLALVLAGTLPANEAWALLDDGAHVFAPVSMISMKKPFDVRLASGGAARWTANLLHGRYILPMHLFLDERKRMLVATKGMTGCCLRGVDAWDGKDIGA